MQALLDQKYLQYNRPDFVADDPISIPHLFSQKEDIEIAGFLAALIAWGKRNLIIRSANNAFLVDSYRAISLHIRMARIYYAGGGTDMAAVVLEHRAILKAYKRRDGACRP